MNTNQIKKFACEARNVLKRGIAAKITTLGFDAKGNVAESMMPQLMQGGSLWKGELHSEGFYHQWMSLYKRVKEKGIQEVYEEVAYTWFNRMMAIRIMQKNGLCEPVLVYTDSARTPRIVDEARMNRLPLMPEESRNHLMELLEDDTKVTEQFAVLIAAWCHANPMMQACFGAMADYTELLLPQNILAEGGFVDMINHTEFITDDDFHSPELIGWLYQFYISERKDEVFAKKGKFEADEIPAATQIFTPNWIVKYMVENTVGRIFLDNNPGPNPFKDKWRYLVEQDAPTPPDSVYHYDELTDLKVADLACGSGHILNECFDILYDLYIYEGYSRSEAIENIFAHNLTGIDLDKRAKQLATFALMIKACQKDGSFVDAHALPQVLTMPQPYNSETDEEVDSLLHDFFQGSETALIMQELKAAISLMKDADSLGSIMKFDISAGTRYAIVQTMDYWKQQSFVPQAVDSIKPSLQLILTLTQSYSALVMNPPYMGGGNMNSELSKYVKDNYEEGKADLFSVFMILATDRLAMNGKYGMINMQSWMFLSSFEKLRTNLLEKTQIDSMLHLGPRTFDELGGEVVQNTAFVISKHTPNGGGSYFRLVDGKNCSEKKEMFLNYAENGAKIYYSEVKQKEFEKIPGSPIGYWVSEKIIDSFSFDSFSKYGKGVKGLDSGNNDIFVRYIWEISSVSSKWKPYCSGGPFRRWYGNNLYFIDYTNVIKFEGACVRNKNLYFKDGFEWSRVSSNHFGVRKATNSIFGGASQMAFIPDLNLNKFLAIFNTKIVEFYIKFLNPTMITQAGDINRIPICEKEPTDLNFLVSENISISRQDWDAHESSWDFKQNELLAIDEDTYFQNIDYEIEKHYEETGVHICIDPAAPQLDSIEWRMGQYKQKWERLFMQLHKNEEELNRQFIDIYGLQDELTPDVPLDEITILQQGEISIEKED